MRRLQAVHTTQRIRTNCSAELVLSNAQLPHVSQAKNFKWHPLGQMIFMQEEELCGDGDTQTGD